MREEPTRSDSNAETHVTPHRGRETGTWRVGWLVGWVGGNARGDDTGGDELGARALRVGGWVEVSINALLLRHDPPGRQSGWLDIGV